ncbi:MAG: hypothetical protein ACJ73D_03450 [Pyrinomonadaceae bacterium]
MENKRHKDCPYPDAIVSYMYDEMPVGERSTFEGHLLDCQVCTDDFAAVSFARFETYDWKRLEFDALATPRIVIPYAEKSVPLGERLWAWMSWVTVVPVAAAIVVCLGIVFVLINRKTADNQSVASVPEVVQPQERAAPLVPALEHVPEAVQPIIAPNAGSHDSTIRPQQASIKKRPILPRTQIARRLAPSMRLDNTLALNIASQLKPAPRLGLNDDEDDRSLRLADLFDETNPPPNR